ncbi:MAG: DNA cytosine methyltransferase [Pedobacter sp.]|nr:MAG: DNA cytosine methyltransferase [Pedobacter sp.]
MDLKDKISLTELLITKHKSKKETLDHLDASLTHYLQGSANKDAKQLKADAILYTQQILSAKKETQISEDDASKAIKNQVFEPIDIPFPSKPKSDFTFIDLFAGIGGFRLALQNIGGKCTYSSEYEPNAKVTYATNFGKVPYGDITKDEIKAYIPKSFDILCGGFPCQAFSIAGHRKGFTETRGTLFFDIQQIIATHRPKVVFLENVKNLVTHDNGNTFKVILEVLQDVLGYKVKYKVLNSMTHANVPQNRERIFIVAFDPKQVPNYANFDFPEAIPLTKTIHHILEPGKQADKYYYSKSHMYYPALEKAMTSVNTLYQWRRVYVRENKNNVCPTLTANMGAGGHNVPLVKDAFGIRKLTPRECFSFQGYPANYVLPNYLADSKLYMQAGNSVTTPLIERIAEKIREVL